MAHSDNVAKTDVPMILAKPWQRLVFCVGLLVAAALGIYLAAQAMRGNSGSDELRRSAEQSSAGLRSTAAGDVGQQGPAQPDDRAGVSEDWQTVETRRQMVEQQLRARGRDITDERVLEAMRRVPRHLFVPEQDRHLAYMDSPQRIGHGQTISQPYIVALMTELARPAKNSKALDVGTGSGYQAAILAELCREVYSIEIIEPLAESARQRLRDLGYTNLTVRAGDGYRGWPEEAPFDLIIVAAAPTHIPQPLIDQLAEGGRLVIPVGDYFQTLRVVEKSVGGKVRQWNVTPVAFVPMTGEAQRRSDR
jgi:protein-L-isoaspartate(D-aspartate) O-methyltransferase